MKNWKRYLFITSEDRNIGLLILRVFVGVGMMTHGIPKIAAGAETWERLGGVMAGIGVPGPAVFWGFMAAVAESAGAFLLLIGAFTTVASFLMASTMTVAAFVAHAGDPFGDRELALFYLCAALLFLFKGAGKYSLDGLIRR